MKIENALRDGKPEPRVAGSEPAAFLDAVEPVENARQVIGRNARAAVRHFQHRSLRGRRRRYRHRATRPGVAQCVLDEIAQNALHQPDIGEHERQIGTYRSLQLNALVRSGELEFLDDILHEVLERERLGRDDHLSRIELRQIEEPSDEPAQLLRLLERDLEIVALLLDRARCV